MAQSHKVTRTALLIGASGLVGGHCLRLLAEESSYESVHLLVRKSIKIPDDIPSRKIIQHSIGSLDAMGDNLSVFRAHDVYCTLGTTIRTAGSQEAFRKVDYDYVVNAARLSAQNGGERFLVVSALGAHVQSSVFYSRTKGEMERDVQASGIANSCAFRPSFIDGNRTESRPGEYLGIVFTKMLAPLLIGPMRKYRVIHARTIAMGMMRYALSDKQGHDIIESDAIERLAYE